MLLGLLAGVPVAPSAAQTAASEYEGAAALGLALRRLGVAKRVLMIGAHPDDERTDLLSVLALRDGAEVAYLSLTRGEGGQNLLGPELGEPLGLIRSEELLAARRLDGARQFFTRAYEFGFSRSADETFRHWPRDSVLADVVGVIRAFRPDVVVSIFSGTPRDGHGHHQAAGILAREAFAASGDPARFPGQIARGLPAHAPGKLYQALWRGSDEPGFRVATGEMDPLLGRSHHEIAMSSRSRHRSQDMGQALVPGPQFTRLDRVAPAGPIEPSMFAGVDTTLGGRARSGPAAATLAAYDARVASLRSRFNPLAPGLLVPEMGEALRLLQRADSLLARAPAAAHAELRFLVAEEIGDLRSALMRASGLRLDAIAGDDRVVPGQAFTLELTLWNGGGSTVAVSSLAPVLPSGWEAVAQESPAATTLGPGTVLARKFTVRIPADASPTEPYFLRNGRVGDTYGWPADPELAGRPFEGAAVRAAAVINLNGTTLPIMGDASFREVDQALGELRRPVWIVPAVSVRLDPSVAVIPAAGPLRFTAELTSEAPEGVAGTLSLLLPPGWTSNPASVPLRFAKAGEHRTVQVHVQAPAGARTGDYTVGAVFTTGDGRRFTRGFQTVRYPHIRAHPLYSPATSRVRAFDVRVPASLRVGYVRGASDRVPEALAQLGVRADLLDGDSLALGDLGRYGAIVVGSRAYEVRPDLVTSNSRLLDYARRGGTLIVQYQQYQFLEGRFAPFNLSIARPHDRVTDEAAPVRLLERDHPVLSSPNRITARDFDGWIQERGLYFAREWDSKFTPLLETGDPGLEPLRGGLLVAPYGEGKYVYTGLAFFRQLPEGVPGAFRLFANLLALGAR